MTGPFAALAASIDEPSPWLKPYASLLRQLIGVRRSSVHDTLNFTSQERAGIRFVDPSSVPEGEPYEAFIHRTGCVPTRDNLHDLFNGVMWHHYPVTKRRLNELQAQHIRARGVSGARGALRDALTLFDENAGLLTAPTALIDALRGRNWDSLFLEHRALWSSAQLVLFGHALLEKLNTPRKPITAHVWVVDAIDDATVASSLTVERLTSKSFLPLPVLGVPGWWNANENAHFYADPNVFRALSRSDGRE